MPKPINKIALRGAIKKALPNNKALREQMFNKFQDKLRTGGTVTPWEADEVFRGRGRAGYSGMVHDSKDNIPNWKVKQVEREVNKALGKK